MCTEQIALDPLGVASGFQDLARHEATQDVPTLDLRALDAAAQVGISRHTQYLEQDLAIIECARNFAVLKAEVFWPRDAGLQIVDQHHRAAL